MEAIECFTKVTEKISVALQESSPGEIHRQTDEFRDMLATMTSSETLWQSYNQHQGHLIESVPKRIGSLDDAHIAFRSLYIMGTTAEAITKLLLYGNHFPQKKCDIPSDLVTRNLQNTPDIYIHYFGTEKSGVLHSLQNLSAKASNGMKELSISEFLNEIKTKTYEGKYAPLQTIVVTSEKAPPQHALSFLSGRTIRYSSQSSKRSPEQIVKIGQHSIRIRMDSLDIEEFHIRFFGMNHMSTDNAIFLCNQMMESMPDTAIRMKLLS
jgi:hypothetical protein